MSAYAEHRVSSVPSAKLSAVECCVLGLVCARPTHGWAIACAVRADAPLGGIYTTHRQAVYRALGALAERELIVESWLEPGTRGPHRTIYAPTSRGLREFERWLAEPVEQVEAMRPQFFLKLRFAEEAGIDPPPIIASQRSELAQQVELLAERDAASDDVQFQLQSARSALSFLDDLAHRRARRARPHLKPVPA